MTMQKNSFSMAHESKRAQVAALLEAIFSDIVHPLDSIGIKVLNLAQFEDGSITGFCQEKKSGLIFEFIFDGASIEYFAYLKENNNAFSLPANKDLILKAWRNSSDSYNDKCQCQRHDSTNASKRTCQKLPCGDSCISTSYTCHLRGSKQSNKKAITRLKALKHIVKKMQPTNKTSHKERNANLPILNPQSRTILQEIAKNNISIGAIKLSSGIPESKIAKAITSFANGISPAEISQQLQIPEAKINQVLESISKFLPQNDPNAVVQKALQENSFNDPYKKEKDEIISEDEDGVEGKDEDKKRQDSNGDSVPCGNSFISSKYICRQKHTKNRRSLTTKSAIARGQKRYLTAKNISKIPIFERYENNLKATGQTLKKNPGAIEDMKLGKYAEKPRKTDKEQLTFFLAGLSDNESQVETGYRKLKKQFDKENFSQKTELFSVTQEETTRGKPKAILSVAAGNLRKGKNPDAEKIAKHILEWKQENPHAKINLLGHSGGGLAGKDVAYILSEAGVNKKDIKVMTLGTPYLDIYQNQTPVKSIIHKDDIYGNVPLRNENIKELKDRPNIEKNVVNDFYSHDFVNYISPMFKSADNKYVKNPNYKKIMSEINNFFGLK